MMGDQGMRKFLVVEYVFYDWGLFDVNHLAMCDTYDEAVAYIDKFEPTIEGLYNKYYIFDKLAEVTKQ